MSPHPRGEVPPAQQQRLKAAVQAQKDADAEVVAAILDACRHGGSYTAVSEASGLARSTVQKTANENGWPTPEMKAAREEYRRKRAEFAAEVEELAKKRRGQA